MNTAVPETRVGGSDETAAMKSSSGNARAVMRSATSFLPVFHVVIIVKSSAPITRGSQPPCRIFTRLAPKSEISTARKISATPITAGFGHFHRSMATTDSNSVVMTIVPVTAIPYAAARALDDWKPMVMSTVQMARNQFTCGTYTWPIAMDEVC